MTLHIIFGKPPMAGLLLPDGLHPATETFQTITAAMIIGLSNWIHPPTFNGRSRMEEAMMSMHIPFSQARMTDLLSQEFLILTMEIFLVITALRTIGL